MYQNIIANQSGQLAVSAIHSIYWEESGNPHGKPVIFLHGGPGAGCSDKTRGFFNPEKYRIIQIDQRGCGHSTPSACIEENTTWDLVADIEKIREHLGIEKWMIFGGSWGSTLALAYSQTHPEHVTELILRGIFLLRKFEIDWFYQQGASYIYADTWPEFLAPVAPEKRSNMLGAYHEVLFGEDECTKLTAAKAWAKWEAGGISLERDEHNVVRFDDDQAALAFARIENHYFTHKGWFDSEDQLLKGVDKIRHIPTVIVQGRYDMCTPFQSAWDLHQVFPEAEFQVVLAGHSAFEPEIAKALVAATDRFAG